MQRKNGFTIVELIVVIVVIAIIATVTIVSYVAVTNNAKQQTVKTDARTVAAQLNKHKAEKGAYPADLDTLTDMPTTDSTFQYTYDATSRAFCLTASVEGASAYVTNVNSEAKEGGCPGDAVEGRPARTNLALNPGYEANSVANWGSFWSPTRTATSSEKRTGTYSMSMVQNATDTTNNRCDGAIMTTTSLPDVIEGAKYRASFWFKAPVGTWVVGSYKVNTGYVGRGGVWMQGNGTWQQINLPTYTAVTADVANTYKLGLQINMFAVQNNCSPALAGGSTVYIDDVMYEVFGTDVPVAQQSDFRDGNSANWLWTGAQNLSTSRGPDS